MTVYEALAACTVGEYGVRAAVTYPGRAKVAFQHGDEVFLIDITDENSDGTSRPGGCIVELKPDDFEAECYQWRPAALAGREELG